MINIVPYKAIHQPYFEHFNRQWIEEWFSMEAVDEYVLTQPEEAILKKGGAIVMALYNDEVAGTAALKKVSDQTYEFTKMRWEKGSGGRELQKHCVMPVLIKPQRWVRQKSSCIPIPKMPQQLNCMRRLGLNSCRLNPAYMNGQM